MEDMKEAKKVGVRNTKSRRGQNKKYLYDFVCMETSTFITVL